MLRIVLCLVATGLALLGSEALVRALELGPPPRPVASGKLVRKSADDLLRFENNPGAEFTLEYRCRSGAEATVVRHTINAQGLRGSLVAVPKPPGVRRIACLGDSYTFGWGVQEGETWPAALQEALAGAAGEPRVEVLNFGVSAYHVVQEVRQLKTKVMSFEPDLALLCWFFNDSVIDDLGASPGPFLVRFLNENSCVRALRSRSQLADLVALTVSQRAAARGGFLVGVGLEGLLAQTHENNYDDSHAGWRKARAALLEADRFLRGKGVPWALALYPVLIRRGSEFLSHEGYGTVKAFCEKNSIRYLDLEPAFAGEELDKLLVHPLDNHPNAAAHRIAARAIVAFLAEHELVPCREG